MKKMLILMLIMSTILSCDLINEIDKCETLDEVRTSTTGLGVIVYDKQSSRINGITVKTETWKEHCNGSIGKPNGDTMTGVTGEGGADVGFFGPMFTYGYSYKTLYDKIHFKVTLSKNGTIITTDESIYTYDNTAPTYEEFKIFIDKKWRN